MAQYLNFKEIALYYLIFNLFYNIFTGAYSSFVRFKKEGDLYIVNGVSYWLDFFGAFFGVFLRIFDWAVLFYIIFWIDWKFGVALCCIGIISAFFPSGFLLGIIRLYFNNLQIFGFFIFPSCFFAIKLFFVLKYFIP